MATPYGPDEDWQDFGACVGKSPSLFWPSIENAPVPPLPIEGSDTFEQDQERRLTWEDEWRKAWGYGRRICEGCEVRAECLEWAIRYPERHGMWGGKDPLERRVLVKERRARNKAERARRQA